MKIKRRSCPLSLHHPHRFLQCSFRFVCVILCYTSLLVVSASLSSPCLFPTPHPDSLFYDFMLMARHYFLGIITFSELSLSALFPLLFLSCPVIPPVYLVSNFNLLRRRILFLFFYWPRPIVVPPAATGLFLYNAET